MFYRNRSLSWSGAKAPSGAVPEEGEMRRPVGTGRNVSAGRIPPWGIPAKPEGGVRAPTKKEAASKAASFLSGYRDSNTGPPAPKAGALANCATPRMLPVKGVQI